MATAILIVVVLILVGVFFIPLVVVRETKIILAAIQAAGAENRLRSETLDTIGNVVFDIRDVLTKASQLKAQKPAESVFDRDTLQPTVPRRYVPMAVRRAQAEAASLGPQTHDAKVRENNARAIESAG